MTNPYGWQRVGAGWSFRGPDPETRTVNPTRPRNPIRVKMQTRPRNPRVPRTRRVPRNPGPQFQALPPYRSWGPCRRRRVAEAAARRAPRRATRRGRAPRAGGGEIWFGDAAADRAAAAAGCPRRRSRPPGRRETGAQGTGDDAGDGSASDRRRCGVGSGAAEACELRLRAEGVGGREKVDWI
jgi:hypothetical protein